MTKTKVTKRAAATAVRKTIATQPKSAVRITAGQRRAILERITPGKKCSR
jgi:hypothetical protein